MDIPKLDIDGLVQDCSNSSALAMELLQSCTKPTIWHILGSSKSALISTFTTDFLYEIAW